MGGAPTHPAWYHNLVANPRVKVEANGETFEADALVVDPDERRRLYDQHADLHASFKDYEGQDIAGHPGHQAQAPRVGRRRGLTLRSADG